MTFPNIPVEAFALTAILSHDTSFERIDFLATLQVNRRDKNGERCAEWSNMIQRESLGQREIEVEEAVSCLGIKLARSTTDGATRLLPEMPNLNRALIKGYEEVLVKTTQEARAMAYNNKKTPLQTSKLRLNKSVELCITWNWKRRREGVICKYKQDTRVLPEKALTG